MTDFQKIALDLRRALGSERAVGELAGMHQGTISRICTSRTVNLYHANGEKLIALHAEHCGVNPFSEIINRIRLNSEQ